MKTYTTVQGDMWEQRDAAPDSRVGKASPTGSEPPSLRSRSLGAPAGWPAGFLSEYVPKLWEKRSLTQSQRPRNEVTA